MARPGRRATPRLPVACSPSTLTTSRSRSTRRRKGRAGIEEYWRGVTADQRDVQFESQVIAVNGNTGVAHWSAKFRLQSSGATIELDGVFVLEFNESGECSLLREWWHVRTPQ